MLGTFKSGTFGKLGTFGVSTPIPTGGGETTSGGVTGAGLAELDEAGAGVSATEQCDSATVEKDPHGCRAGDGLTVGQRVTEGSVEGNDAVDADYLHRPTGARGISDDAESGRWCDLVVRGDQ